ncbi:MAG: NADH-quinone oxidoreductase subunit C [Candidatus Omnitrophota bacterium]|jgi:NADH-quinone oxidoreductase subunit C
MPNGEVFGLIKLRVPGVTVEEQTKAIVIPKDGILEAARCLVSQGFDNLHCITAVDNKDHIELIYNFYSLRKHAAVTLKARLSGDLSVESLARSWKSADWLEREVFDLFGVIFLNHPNLKRILNPDEWTIHPLRKA